MDSSTKTQLWIVSYNDPETVEKAVECLKLVEKIPFERISCNWRDKVNASGDNYKEGIERRLRWRAERLPSQPDGRHEENHKRKFNTRFWNTDQQSLSSRHPASIRCFVELGT
jgi:hypothetical protein